MVFFAFLLLAATTLASPKQHINQALEIINEEFKVNVTGGNTDFWELKQMLYYNRENNDNAQKRMVLILQNFFNKELSLHDITIHQARNSTDIALGRHIMPEFVDGNHDEFKQKILNACLDEDFAIMEAPQMQYLNFSVQPVLRQEEFFNYTLVRSRGMQANSSFNWVDVTVATNSTGEELVFKQKERIVMGCQGQYISKDLKYAVIIAGMAILSGAVMWTWAGCYWQTKGRLPWFDNRSEEVEPNAEDVFRNQ